MVAVRRAVRELKTYFKLLPFLCSVQLKITFVSKFHVLGWHIPIPYKNIGMASSLGRKERTAWVC